MANDEIHADDFLSPGNDLQFTVLTQIMQVTATMRHIDEFLLWFVRMLTTSRFGIQIAQVWATQPPTAGLSLPRLRSMASQDATLAENIVVNTNVNMVVARNLANRRSSPCQPVDAIFSQHVATLLKRHGLYYSASFFLSDSMLLPPPMSGPLVEKTPVPLVLSLLLFLHQSSQADMLPLAHSLLKQALPIVSNRGLLLPAGPDAFPLPMAQHPTLLPALVLFELIPHRIEDVTSSPFGVLPDKHIRQLLAAINGRRTLAELCRVLHVEMKALLPMLQILLKQHRIQICGPGGKPTDISMWLNNN